MSEKEIVKKIGATPVKNSGRGIMKGDFTWQTYIGDVKEGKSFDLNESAWAKICSDAIQHGLSWEPMILRALPNGVMIACIAFSTLQDLELGVVWDGER